VTAGALHLQRLLTCGWAFLRSSIRTRFQEPAAALACWNRTQGAGGRNQHCWAVPAPPRNPQSGPPGSKHLVAVASGKGRGWQNSTTATKSGPGPWLPRERRRMLDADLYGPSPAAVAWVLSGLTDSLMATA